MNDHEAQRIAAAMHELRPDWPASSLLTLIRKHLIGKPRRDVTVALAWVACESGTATPARVLEAGPWWRAVGVDGTGAVGRHPFDPKATCSTCGKSEADCRRNPHAEHEFISIDAYRGELGHAHIDADGSHARAQGLRDIKADVTPNPAPPTVAAHNPAAVAADRSA
jgi:hypothetical protein